MNRAKVKYHNEDEKGIYGGGREPNILEKYLALVPSEVNVMIIAYDIDNNKDSKDINNWNKKVNIDRIKEINNRGVPIKDGEGLIKMQQPTNIVDKL